MHHGGSDILCPEVAPSLLQPFGRSSQVAATSMLIELVCLGNCLGRLKGLFGCQ